MICESFELPNGSRGIMCRGRRPRRKCACGRPATRQCDFEIRRQNKPRRTCNNNLCDACAVRVGPDLDHCPDHAAPDAPVQMTMEGL